METPLIDKDYIVQKQIGKGGWFFVVISEIPAAQKQALGLIRVSGFIDTYALNQFNLLPMKDGSMMLPLKSAVRKQIGKKEGDTVHVTLYADASPVVIPDDILICLLDAPKAHQFF